MGLSAWYTSIAIKEVALVKFQSFICFMYTKKQLTLGFIFCYSFKLIKQINCNNMHNNKSSLISNWNRSLGINEGESPKTFSNHYQHWYISTSQYSEKYKIIWCFWIFKYGSFKGLFQCSFTLYSSYTWKEVEIIR